MASLFDNAVEVFSDAGVTSLTSAAYTLSGSNRYLLTQVCSGAGSPVTPSNVKHGGSGGTAMSSIATEQVINTFGRHNIYELVAPASGSQTAYADWSTGQDETMIIAANFKDVDQSTPKGTVASNTGTASGAPTVSVSSASGDLCVDFMFWLDLTGSALNAAADGSQTVIHQIEDPDFQYEGLGASYKSAAGGTTVFDWTITGGPLGGTDWGEFGLALKGAGGGGGGGFFAPYYYEMNRMQHV